MKAMIKFFVAIVALTIVLNASAAADLEVNTPGINAIKQSMQARHAQLAAYYGSGAVGLTADGMMIQGSVVSLSQNEMTAIGKFLQELKSNKTFTALWPKIELGSVQRRTIKTYDVVDFVLTGEVKK